MKVCVWLSSCRLVKVGVHQIAVREAVQLLSRAIPCWKTGAIVTVCGCECV